MRDEKGQHVKATGTKWKRQGHADLHKMNTKSTHFVTHTNTQILTYTHISALHMLYHHNGTQFLLPLSRLARTVAVKWLKQWVCVYSYSMCICMSLVAVTLGLFITKCRPQGSSSWNKLCNTYQGKFREKKRQGQSVGQHLVFGLRQHSLNFVRPWQGGRKKQTKNCCCCTASREKSRLIMITVPVAEFVF